MKLMLSLLVSVLMIFILCYFISLGYDQSWTGFQTYTNNKGEVIPSKKLWDWLQLLIVPILLAVGIWWLNKSQKISEQQIETDRQQQKTLEDYFNCMTELLLTKNLRDINNNQEARIIARTRSLAVLRTLDGGRKAQVIQFLCESRLIDKNPIVQLNGADLSEAAFNDAALGKVELRGVYFNNAKFKGANLADADLRGSDFTNADFTNAYLVNANMTQAILKKAKLRKVNLTGAILESADLEKADFKGAKPANLSK